METTTCSNCGADMSTPYCGQCGQKRQGRITFKLVASNVYEAFIDFESPFLKSLFQLTINPGRVYREYLDGARVRYFSPVRYSLWILTLMVAVAAFKDATIIEFPIEADVPKDDVPVLFQVQDFLNATIIPATFFMALWMAGITRLVLRKEKYGIAELFVPYLLNTSHLSLVTSGLILTGAYSYELAFPLIGLLAVAYMTWGIGELYQPRRKQIYVWCLLLSVFGTFFFYGLFSYVATVVLDWQSSGLT